MNGMARGSGNLIAITGTDRTNGTLSRPGQALVQNPVRILVTGPVQQLAGGADPGVADQGAGPDGRFWGQKVARGVGGIGVGRGHTRDCKGNGTRWIYRHAGFTTPFTTLSRRRGAWSGLRW
jgi:hypothetical protein